MTNAGYIEYTDNLLNSINENKTNIDLNVYALDKKTFDHFKKKTNTLNFFDNKEKNSEFLKQNDDEFGKLMLKKFEIIYDSLIKNDLTLYIDGDIVIKKNFSSVQSAVLSRRTVRTRLGLRVQHLLSRLGS